MTMPSTAKPTAQASRMNTGIHENSGMSFPSRSTRRAARQQRNVTRRGFLTPG